VRVSINPVVVDLPTAEVGPQRVPTLRLPNAQLTTPVESSITFVEAPLVPTLGAGDTVADRYLIESVIMEGELARVYKAVQLATQRTVALKVLSARYAGDNQVRKLAQRELDALCRISHPNVVTVFDGDVSGDDRMWIAMEHLRGETLRRQLARVGRLSCEHALEIMFQVLSALAAAHEQGVLHLDLKPENIFISDNGLVKVIDLGTAKLLDGTHKSTARGRAIGTPEYMAPERLMPKNGRPVQSDERSDIYSAALVFYEMLAGHHPMIPEGFEDGKRPARELIAWRQMEFDPPIPDAVPSAIWDVLRAALDKDPEQRPQSFRAWLLALREAHAESGGEARPLSTLSNVSTRLEQRRVRHSLFVGAFFGAVFWALLVMAIVGVRVLAGAEVLVSLNQLFTK
jgi:serine/threonine-protein kinase